MGTFLPVSLELDYFGWLLHGSMLATGRQYSRLQAGWHIVLEQASMWQPWNTGYFYSV